MENVANKSSFTVRQARLLSGKSQRKIADEMHVNVDTYRRMELYPQSATIERAKQFSEIVGIPLDQIFFAQ